MLTTGGVAAIKCNYADFEVALVNTCSNLVRNDEQKFLLTINVIFDSFCSVHASMMHLWPRMQVVKKVAHLMLLLKDLLRSFSVGRQPRTGTFNCITPRLHEHNLSSAVWVIASMTLSANSLGDEACIPRLL